MAFNPQKSCAFDWYEDHGASSIFFRARRVILIEAVWECLSIGVFTYTPMLFVLYVFHRTFNFLILPGKSLASCPACNVASLCGGGRGSGCANCKPQALQKDP